MRKLILTTAAVLAFGTSSAFAALSTEEIVAMFPDAQKIEIKRGLSTTKVEVTTGGEKIEVVYDNATNAELTRETGTASPGDSASGIDFGVAVGSSDDDHGSGHDSGHDDGEDHDSSDSEDGHHDSGDDHSDGDHGDSGSDHD